MPGWLGPWLILIGGFVVVAGVLVVVVLLAFLSRGSRLADQTRPDRGSAVSGHDPNSAGMAQCPACGAPVDRSSRYCGRCGGTMGQGDSSSRPLCPNCGRELSPEDRFCTECGQEASDLNKEGHD